MPHPPKTETGIKGRRLAECHIFGSRIDSCAHDKACPWFGDCPQTRIEQIARDRITAAYLPIPEPDSRLPRWLCALFITGASLAGWGLIAAVLPW